jgi:DmsE family decaheme c-type cytochrome
MKRFFVPLSAAIWLAVFAIRVVAFSPPAGEAAPIPPVLVPAIGAIATNDAPPAPPAHAVAIPATAQDGGQVGYVGQDTCVTCHEGYDSAVNKSKHGFAKDPRTPAAAQGCESCHGPGAAHVENPESVKPKEFSKMAATAVNESCTTCHNRGEHAMWNGSAHDMRNMACTSCHSVHTPKTDEGQLKFASQTATCANCHRDKVNKLDRSGHMPVSEGKMECSSCHTVHGSKNTRLLRAGFTANESCTSCHADKRGPFLWEHAPVSESCVSCHDPHGSSNERMLVAKQPFLCQRCHNHARHPATVYDKAVQNTSNRIFGRSCASCHAQIHGSNHPSGNFLVR